MRISRMGTAVATAAITSALIMSLIGCGTKPSGSTTPETTQDVETADTTESQESFAQEPIDKLAVIDSQPFSLNTYLQGMFSDGVAWVDIPDNSEISLADWANHPVLIDNMGNVLIDYGDGNWTAEDVPNTASNYFNGLALIQTSEGSIGEVYGAANRIIDKQGNVVWSTDVEGIEAADTYFGSENVNEVKIIFDMEKINGRDNLDTWGYNFYTSDWYKGYAIVEFDVNSYEYSGSKYDVLDSDCNWIIEPNETDMRIGKYCLLTENCLLRFRSGEVTEVTEEEQDNHYMETGQPYFDWIEAQEYSIEHDGLTYSYSNGFKDADGNVVIDTSEYEVYDINYLGNEFCNGYASLTIGAKSGSGGGYFVTVIDTKGTQMFSPKSLTEDYLPYRDCAFYLDGSFYDSRGEKLGTLECEEASVFSDGRAWVQVNNEMHCIDETGEIVF